MDTTSASLLQRLRQSTDQAAWNRFCGLYTPLLFYWARRAGLQDQDAADLVQDVQLTLVRKLPDFRYDRHKSFRGWLRTILHNQWRDRGRRRPAGLPRADGVELAELPYVGLDDPLEEAEYRQHLVNRALQLMQAEFPPKTWRACWEHVVASRSAAEVAAELSIAPGSVYVAKARVLSRLRQELVDLLD